MTNERGSANDPELTRDANGDAGVVSNENDNRNMPATAEAPSLTTAQTRVKRWVGESGEGVFKVTRLAVIALTVALIVLVFVTRNVPAYLAGLGFVASLVATEGAVFRFLAHDTEELKPADRLGKGLAFLAAGVGVVGGLVGIIAAYIA